jgi:hypothetical protein
MVIKKNTPETSILTQSDVQKNKMCSAIAALIMKQFSFPGFKTAEKTI